MKSKLLTMLDKTLDALPLTGAAIGVTVLACVFSGTLRDILQRADLNLLAGAVALLPLSVVLLAFGYGMRANPAKRKQQLERRKAMLRATYDLDNQR